jgi:hypothetical protein
VFILGSAAKAKKLPHMSTTRKQKGEGNNKPTPEELPAPIDFLDILQAYSYKIEN